MFQAGGGTRFRLLGLPYLDKDHATPKSVPTIAADRQLWTILRLSFLHAVWCLHCQRSLDPERHPVTPAIVVAATVAAVKRLMRLDYARTIGDVRTMTASQRQWFRDTSVPTLAPQNDKNRQNFGFFRAEAEFRPSLRDCSHWL